MRYLFLLVLTSLLVACASPKIARAPHSVPAASENFAPPIFIPHQMSGRLIARYQENYSATPLENHPENGSIKTQTARFFLQRDRLEHSIFQILGPFGVVLMQLEMIPNKITLTQIGQAPLSAASLPALVARYAVKPLPIPIPLPQFYDWLNGHGVDQTGITFTVNASGQIQSQNKSQNEEGRTEIETADGWHLDYRQWGQEPATLVITQRLRTDIELQIQRQDLQLDAP